MDHIWTLKVHITLTVSVKKRFLPNRRFQQILSNLNSNSIIQYHEIFFTSTEMLHI